MNVGSLIDIVNVRSPAHFDYGKGRVWVYSHQWFTAAVCCVYLLAIVIGQRLMRHRDPFMLKAPLVAWNLGLALFSIMGSLSILPEFFKVLDSDGLVATYCRSVDYFSGTSGFWAFMFCISKLVELGDTMFLILRKKPIIFLHWSHHVSVLMQTFIAYPTNTSSMRWGAGMNYLVHSVMYSYFTVRATGLKLPRSLASLITTIQMSQFFTAMVITLHLVWLQSNGDPRCPVSENDPIAVYPQFVLYILYTILFTNFFFHAYCSPRKQQQQISSTNNKKTD